MMYSWQSRAERRLLVISFSTLPEVVRWFFVVVWVHVIFRSKIIQETIIAMHWLKKNYFFYVYVVWLRKYFDDFPYFLVRASPNLIHDGLFLIQANWTTLREGRLGLCSASGCKYISSTFHHWTTPSSNPTFNSKSVIYLDYELI